MPTRRTSWSIEGSAAIFVSPEATEPDYVLPMGVIDSLLRFDGWDGDPLGRQDRPQSDDPLFVADGADPARLIATRDHDMLIAAPSCSGPARWTAAA